VCDGSHAVVRNACKGTRGIALVADREEFIPGAVRSPVITDAETQSIRARDLGPCAHDVALRSNVHAVPRLMLRIPAIEIVVMRRQRDEIFGTGTLVQVYQVLRIPLLRFPEMTDVLVSELRWMAIILYVMLILRLSLDVHVPRIPVTLFGHA